MKKKSILKSWLFTLLVGTSAGIVNAQGNLQIGAGATLFSNGTSIVTLQNAKLTNNGSYTASNGTLLYTGSATNANASANGSGTTQLKNLTVNKSANALQINKNVAVATALTLTAGGVELVAGNIDFGTTGSLLSETATNRAYGTGGELRCTAALSAPSAQNPANLGVVITSAANLGTTTVYRGHSAFSPNGSAINRYYKITPTTNTGLNATLRFNYFDAELNGNNEATMQVWYSSNSGATWSQITASNRDAAANWVEVTGVNALGWFTLAPATAVPTTKTWTGTTSTAWATSTNWNPAGAPTCSDDILIPNTTNKPVISAAASAQNLTIQAGGGITINAGQTLSLCGNLANSGIVSFGAGNVKLQGTGAQTITGTSTIANLEVAGDYTIGSASIDKLNVSGILKKTSGKLYTTDKLTLLSTSTQTALIQENGGLLSGNATMQRYIGG